MEIGKNGWRGLGGECQNFKLFQLLIRCYFTLKSRHYNWLYKKRIINEQTISPQHYSNGKTTFILTIYGILPEQKRNGIHINNGLKIVTIFPQKFKKESTLLP